MHTAGVQRGSMTTHHRSTVVLAVVSSAALLVPSACSSGDAAESGRDNVTPAASTSPSYDYEPSLEDDYVACFNGAGGQCLGPLDPGTYTTQVMNPGIRYTVPDGWVNAEDLPGNFQLYREDDPQEGYLGGSYVGVYTDVRAPRACKEEPDPSIGSTPAELARWYAADPGLEATAPRPVTVGGLDGLVVDVPMARDWDGTCPFSKGRPVAPLIIGSGVSSLYHVADPAIDVRLVLLSWHRSNVTIEITSVRKQHSKQEYLRMVRPILESLRFRTR